MLYLDYEAKLTRESQEEGFLGTLATSGLTSAAATVGGQEAKILATTAAGLAGVGEAYNKDVLVDRTVALLQEQMRAQRKLVRANVLGRLQFPIADYPLELALSDVETYYRAGTITGALIGASEDFGARLRAATAIEEAAVSTRFSATILGPSILAYWRSSPARRQTIDNWLNRNGITIPLPFFARSNAYATDQERLVADLGIPSEAGPSAGAPAPVPTPAPARPVPASPGRAGPAPLRPGPAPAAPAAAIERDIRAHPSVLSSIRRWMAANGIDGLPTLMRADHEDAQRQMIKDLSLAD
ncbi:hypothetical protein [Lichenihabitans psoromatis]|uniref:hypothetical protein n=1 Tax=Lichenihabitans psoromatis TaxID=2528642 RepID=UPI0010369D57|nr:hypothetical protein [Lichenihabitans psoromatis]